MTDELVTFAQLGLPKFLLTTLESLGYQAPSPIQEACIPLLLNGKDVLGMAQTGSGKTAAFALPMLCKLDPTICAPQILVLAPTRELALQVAAACEQYAKGLPNLLVLALYGGQRYDIQLRALKQGPQVVVATPGRLLDHLRRGTLNFAQLKALVLDEADEMLRMGFIEEVEAILATLPPQRQTALFSATMPDPIRRIARQFMQNPAEVRMDSKLKAAPEIEQKFWFVQGSRKEEALLRFLEVESFEAAIIFVRTKTATLEIAEVLEANGYNCAALNGDMNQSVREKTLERLKDGRINILIATDVAARGLDVERISLVINYDIPLDVESYVHRIGRTGRAGRSGKALLFVNARELRLLRSIERVLKSSITEVMLPKNSELARSRLENFVQTLTAVQQSQDLIQYEGLLAEIQSRFSEQTPQTLAAALLKVAQQGRSLLLPPDSADRPSKRERRDPRAHGFFVTDRESFGETRGISRSRGLGGSNRRISEGMDLYRIEVGREDGVEIRHIVGAIANEGDLDSKDIGNIKLFATHALLELPKQLAPTTTAQLARTRILNKPIRLRKVSGQDVHDQRKTLKGPEGLSSQKLMQRFSSGSACGTELACSTT